MSVKLKQVEEALEAKQKEISGIFKEAGPGFDMGEVKSLSGDSHSKVEQIRALELEANELGEQRDELRKEAADMRAIKARAEGFEEGSSLGEHGDAEDVKADTDLGGMFIKSAGFKNRSGANGPEAHIDYDMTKTLMQTTQGFAPEVTRSGRVEDFLTTPIQVTQFIPRVPTNQSAIMYMRETVYNNAAAETPENGLYPEAALEYAEETSPIRKIAVYLPVTDEQLEDEPAVRARINNRLPFMLDQRLDAQILNGDGVGVNLEGIANRAGIQTQAQGADVLPDAIFHAMTNIRVNAFSVANLVIMEPTDWSIIRLTRTTDGIYLWGSPSDAGPERIWGTQVLQANAQPKGTALVLDTMHTELAVKRGVDMQISNSHADDFINGRQAIRADMRVGLQVYRPQAICEVTGVA